MKPAMMVAAALLLMTVRANAQTQTVVFVCEHGSAKSVVAAAHFNRLAAERGLPFRAVSRGTAPDPTVPAPITNGLATEKMSVPAGFTPTQVAATDVAGASKVVTFDITLPVSADASKLSRWDKMPALSDGYGPASAAIATKFEAIISEIATTKKKQN